MRAPAVAATDRTPGRRLPPAAVAAAFAVAVVAVLQTVSIPLLPALTTAFDTSLASVSWVATSTLIVGAAANPILGRAGDMYGKRRLVLGCLAAAVVGCVISATAGSLAVVVAGRAVQGLASGVIPLAYGVIRDHVSSRQLGRAVALVTAAGAGIGAGLGPVVMGAVLSERGWRSVFWVIAVLLVVAMAAVALTTTAHGPRVRARFDVPGAVVLAAALVLLLLAITNGSRWGWASPAVLALVLAAVTSMAWWVRWERSRAEPVVDLALNGRGMVLLAHIGGVMVGCATFAQYITSFTLVVLPADTGHGLGRSLAVAGLLQLPGALVLTVAVAVTNRLRSIVDPASLLGFGAVLIGAGFTLGIVRHGSLGELALSIVVVSAGLGVGQCAVPILVLDHVDAAHTAAVNAVSALARVAGSVLASALVTTVLAAGSVVVAGGEQPAEWAFQVAYAVGAVPAVLVGAASWRQSCLAF
jgi:MFS family permease